jgi:hypothetical protein
MAAPTDVRGSLHRRFTTTTVPTMNGISGLSPIGQQRLQAAGETQPTVSAAPSSNSRMVKKRVCKKWEFGMWWQSVAVFAPLVAQRARCEAAGACTTSTALERWIGACSLAEGYSARMYCMSSKFCKCSVTVETPGLFLTVMLFAGFSQANDFLHMHSLHGALFDMLFLFHSTLISFDRLEATSMLAKRINWLR